MELGQIPETAKQGKDHAYARRWDPRPELTPLDAVDLGWIGEDAQGVWTTVHPQAALLAHPELFGPVSEFQAGLQEITPDDWQTKSAFEFECKVAMACAMNAHLAPPEREDS